MAGGWIRDHTLPNGDIRTKWRVWVRRLAASRDRPSFRLTVLAVLATAWLMLVVVRLWDLQIHQASRLVEKAQRQQEGLIEIGAPRGRIFDRFGVELARSTPVDSIGVFPSKIGDPELAADLLSKVLGVDPAEIREKLSRERFQWIRRLAEPGEAERIRELPLEGLHFEQESKRYYPKGSVAAHVLGAVGLDHTGLAGLEQTFENKLHGTPGWRAVQVDALRRGYSSEVTQQPVPGYDLVLTIDQRIQVTAETELARAIKTTHAEAGTVVVMDPSNGDILGMANWPTFDPNDRTPSEEELARRTNYGLSHMIEPGSTFKVVTLSAALEEKLTTPEEMIDCENGRIHVGSRRIRDHKSFGLLSVADILARSSNVGAIKLGLRLTPERLFEYAHRFGIGQAPGLPLPGEAEGMLRNWERWHPSAIGSVAIGQEVGVSAVQMARAISVIANGGLLVTPRVVEAIVSPDGVREERQARPPERVLTAETAATMRALMERVVRGGTARLAQTPGYRVAGKTGTAQKVDPETGRYSTKDYVASFVGFAPVNSPSVLAVVVLDSPVGPYHGGQVAAPVFSGIATEALRYRDVPPELPIDAKPAAPVPAEWLTDFVGDEDETQWPKSALAAFPEPVASETSVLAVTANARPAAALSWFSTPSPAKDGEAYAGQLEEAAPRPAPSKSKAAGSQGPARLRVVNALLPDFSGATVGSVIVRANALGLELKLRGSGVAWRQWPAAGTAVRRGDTVAVDFRAREWR
ncbi:MAG: penicillin-binding transpeptidase domain-containing protein [Acidobacteria bacterium]|nr:penicillin-binding transpeptidase domain-containing protein [Acidobacteriota bacterium]